MYIRPQPPPPLPSSSAPHTFTPRHTETTLPPPMRSDMAPSCQICSVLLYIYNAHNTQHTHTTPLHATYTMRTPHNTQHTHATPLQAQRVFTHTYICNPQYCGTKSAVVSISCSIPSSSLLYSSLLYLTLLNSFS